MKTDDEFEDMYEDVVIDSYGIPVVITDVLVRKHRSTGRKLYINHPDSIHRIERGLKAALGVVPRGNTSYRRRLGGVGTCFCCGCQKTFGTHITSRRVRTL